MAYAKRLTKERLIQEGFTEITKEGRLFKGEQEVFPFWNGKVDNPNRYLCINVCQRDSEGHLIKGKDRIYKYTRKDGSIGESISWQAKLDTFALHRAIWAWHHGEVPEGMVVDHINNKHFRLEDYHLDNLQLLTPQENVTKEREESTKQIKCKLNKPREHYETKLSRYLEAYENAKLLKNAELAHKLRSNVAQTRARLRYYDSHIDEVEQIKESIEMTSQEKIAKEQDKKDLQILQYWKKVFRDAGNKKMWHHCCDVEKLWKNGELNQLAKNHVIEVLLGLEGAKHETI